VQNNPIQSTLIATGPNLKPAPKNNHTSKRELQDDHGKYSRTGKMAEVGQRECAHQMVSYRRPGMDKQIALRSDGQDFRQTVRGLRA